MTQIHLNALSIPARQSITKLMEPAYLIVLKPAAITAVLLIMTHRIAQITIILIVINANPSDFFQTLHMIQAIMKPALTQYLVHLVNIQMFIVTAMHAITGKMH